MCPTPIIQAACLLAGAELAMVAAVLAINTGDNAAALAARQRLAPLLAGISDPFLRAICQLAMAWTLPITGDFDGALREAAGCHARVPDDYSHHPTGGERAGHGQGPQDSGAEHRLANAGVPPESIRRTWADRGAAYRMHGWLMLRQSTRDGTARLGTNAGEQGRSPGSPAGGW